MIDISPRIKGIAKVKANQQFFDRRKLLIGLGVRPIFSTAVWSDVDRSIDGILNADTQAEGLLERMNEIVLLYEDAAS